jgi:CRISPR-associated exonuclease Cas4
MTEPTTVPAPPLTVTDLRQWLYCPRVAYYHYFPPARRVVTFKMQRGVAQHERTTDLEHRRTLAAYNLADGERRFGVAVDSPHLGVRGILDMAIIRAEEAIPVEYKSAGGPLARNHRYQLALQALLLAEQTSLPVRRAFVYWIARREAEEVPLSPHLVRDVPRRLAAIRAALAQGLPEPTDHRGRCLDCEFRRFCGDVA